MNVMMVYYYTSLTSNQVALKEKLTKRNYKKHLTHTAPKCYIEKVASERQ
ncbi:hypothetical protein QF033_000836 [Bacillus pumilus]|nr:hypothetical protein [Bacillus pumilus]